MNYVINMRNCGFLLASYGLSDAALSAMDAEHGAASLVIATL